MRTIYLHIGTEKTGSTTIQGLLSENRAELLKRGYLFPISGGRRNHTKLALYASNHENPGLFRLDRGRVEMGQVEVDKATLRRSFPDMLATELAQHPEKNVIFSNEHCSSRLRTDDEVLKLKDLLSRFSDRIKIIIYLRRQEDAAISLYSTIIKGGSTTLPGTFVKKKKEWFDYFKLLTLWGRHFGKENLIVRIFEKKEFRGNRLEDDFFNAIGIDGLSGLKQLPPQNLSLDRIRLEFLRMFNEVVPRLEGDDISPMRGNLVAILLRNSSNCRLTLNPQDIQNFRSRYGESNAKVAKEFFARPSGALFSEESGKSNGQPYRELTSAEIMKVSSELWISKQTENIKLRKKIEAIQKN